MITVEELSAQKSIWTTYCVEVGLGEPLSIEAYVCRGKAERPCAIITGGVHGDEFEGPVAIGSLTESLDLRSMSGSLIAFPVLNPMAFSVSQRMTPSDGRNLNRTFPGQPEGTPTERLAHWFFENFVRRADFLLDLHSGGVDYRVVPLAGFYGPPTPGNASFDAARYFGLRHLWRLPETAGVLSYEAWKLGITATGTEYLGAGQLSPDGVKAYTGGIFSCLAAWGISDARCTVQPGGSAYQSNWKLAECSGIFRACSDLGQSFDPGDILAEIIDMHGKTVQVFTSGDAGIVLGLRSKALIREGDWGVLTGIPVEE